MKENKKPPFMGDSYVVINVTLELMENSTATLEQQKAIARANQQIQRGDHQGTLEDLHLAGIGVTEKEYLMPLQRTQQMVIEALELLKSKKYYEANFILQGVEQGIVINSETVTG